MSANNESSTVGQNSFFYGWVIVAASAVLLAAMAGIMYSYGIFFKHLIAEFGWNRAATSGVYSLFVICHGLFGLPMGLLVDRFGPGKVLALCTFIAGVGLLLTSQITALWQLYLTFGLIVGGGLSGIFPAGTATTARWFTKQRGLALGLVASGIGIGTLILPPLIERLINATGWSTSYLIIGFVTWAIMIPSSLLLRRSPLETHQTPRNASQPVLSSATQGGAKQLFPELVRTVKAAASHKPLWLLVSIYFFFNFCLQMVMVHLVNYATDIGISSLIAATFLSFIGIASFSGRIAMGAWSDRIGGNNAIIISGALMGGSLIFLLFTGELWTFYLFAVIFGFAYGGEVPQMPVLVGRYYGLRAAAALVGIIVAFSGFGGALGSWLAGRIFDITQSYQAAFIVAIVSSLAAITVMLILKKVKPIVPD